MSTDKPVRRSRVKKEKAVETSPSVDQESVADGETVVVALEPSMVPGAPELDSAGLPVDSPDPVISVIVPTIEGREEYLAACVRAYRVDSVVPLEVIVEDGHESCGAAWIAGAKRAKGEILHFTADDLVPHAGWDVAAMAALGDDTHPAAVVMRLNGTLESAGLTDATLLADDIDGLVVQAAGIPFLRREWWDAVKKDFPPLHYSTDLLLSFLLAERGVSARVCSGYRFTHGFAMEGRKTSGRLDADYREYRGIVDRVTLAREADA